RQFRAPACMLGAQNGRRIQRRDTCLLERANETIFQSRQLATEHREHVLGTHSMPQHGINVVLDIAGNVLLLAMSCFGVIAVTHSSRQANG
ncbi:MULTISPECIES: hypothetical protein, partial [unclassified Bradyrhizobium]|uniref:hypothetical protein n=1 Tax=unclassified Bradyrhizobium TaxID=2631580 RepID=UPI001FF8F088